MLGGGRDLTPLPPFQPQSTAGYHRFVWGGSRSKTGNDMLPGGENAGRMLGGWRVGGLTGSYEARFGAKQVTSAIHTTG